MGHVGTCVGGLGRWQRCTRWGPLWMRQRLEADYSWGKKVNLTRSLSLSGHLLSPTHSLFKSTPLEKNVLRKRCLVLCPSYDVQYQISTQKMVYNIKVSLAHPPPPYRTISVVLERCNYITGLIAAPTPTSTIIHILLFHAYSLHSDNSFLSNPEINQQIIKG